MSPLSDRCRPIAAASAATVAALICLLLTGCLATGQFSRLQATALAKLGNKKIVEVERVHDPLDHPTWNRIWQRPAKPTERTAQVLRRFNLEQHYEEDPDRVILWLVQLADGQPTMEEVHALAELALKQGDWSHACGDHERATRLYTTAILEAYHFLFDRDLDLTRNAYDPQFRNICDIYNRSLEGLLREVCQHDGFEQGYQTHLGSDVQGMDLSVRIEGRWENQEFERFELVNDYHTSGFANQHHTYGLGVPLIAIRQQQELYRPFEKYYPPELSLPMTAFLHVLPQPVGKSPDGAEASRKAVLSLYDPLERTVVQTDQRRVPLESDITTPLAYGLRDPLLNQGVLATLSLLDADEASESLGMYMLEPYDPQKIPVVMVHGLWSSPTTWAQMFNDLRAQPAIHENYQFWFYYYPTGQPFWFSAMEMRQALRTIRDEVDPEGNNPALDKMVLVGHSMGGLVSTLQVTDSENHFWNLISDQSIAALAGSEEIRQRLEATFFFKPNPSIARVITIATPFQGSEFANPATRWVGQKLIHLPSLVSDEMTKFARANRDQLKDASLLTTSTSVDALAPDSPFFAAMRAAQVAPEVKTHNIVGRQTKRAWLTSSGSQPTYRGDGVVELDSASRDQADSQIFVPEEHSKVHQHPGAILEVSRILLQHLAEMERAQVRQLPTWILSQESEEQQ